MIPPLLKVALIKFVHSNMGQSRAVTIITTLRAYDNHIFLMSILNVKIMLTIKFIFNLVHHVFCIFFLVKVNIYSRYNQIQIKVQSGRF